MTTKLGTPIADFETQLATQIDPGDTGGTLQSYTDDDSVSLPNGKYFFTLDIANSVKEHIVCDLTAGVMSNIKSISRQGVQTVGAARKHRIGASVTITDWAHIKYMNDLLAGSTLFNSAVKLGYDGDPSLSSGDLYYFATVDYVNDVAIAGAPDAGALVKGIGFTSVAPASPTNPIFVGDNDPRMPTQAENDALVGTSGNAVSGTNKLVDNDDTTSTPTAGKVARFDSDGFLRSSKLIRDFIARENVTAGDALCLYPYQSDGGILIDTTDSQTSGTGKSITIAANSNRILVVFVATDGDTTPTITFGGVSMTQLVGGTGANLYCFYLLAPGTGAQTLTISASSTWTAYSLYNVVQAVPAVTANQNSASSPQNITTTVDGAVVLTALGTAQDNATATVTAAGAAAFNVLKPQSGGSGSSFVASGYSGQIFGTQAVPTTWSSGFGLRFVGLQLLPITAPSYGNVFKASAASSTISYTANKYSAFVGFANSTVTSGNAVATTIGGVATGLTGLSQNLTHYLSNTPGAISATAGTNSKKVGQAVSATELNIIQSI